MPQAARGLLQHFHEILFHEFRHCFNAASGKRSVATCYSVASRGSGWSGFNAASGKRSVATVIIYIFSIGLVKFQCRKRQEVCCNKGLPERLYRAVHWFQCRKRQEVCCNINAIAVGMGKMEFQCRKRQEVCCNSHKLSDRNKKKGVSMPQAARGLLQHCVLEAA